MEKEKISAPSKKRLSEPSDSLPAQLPPPPPPPPLATSSSEIVQNSSSQAQQQKQHHHQQQHQHQQIKSTTQILPERFRRLLDYKERERTFLKNLNEAIIADSVALPPANRTTMTTTSSGSNNSVKNESERKLSGSSSSSEVKLISNEKMNQQQQQQQQQQQVVQNIKMSSSSSLDRNLKEAVIREECESYIMPLMQRTGLSISAALVTHDAFEQLNRLHGLLDQMLALQEQNYQMSRYLRDVRTLCELKKLQKKEPEISPDGDYSDTELDLENQVSLLSTILAAGNSASTKRSSAKRQRERSKSVIADDIQMFMEKEATKQHLTLQQMQNRRQSAFSASENLANTAASNKAKVSKWTKVKAAFKWERANVPVLNEGKSSDSGIGLTPINNEIARYLRVPSVPCAGSSADSVFSSSSGHFLSCGGSIPPTPGTISSASSVEDVGPNSEEMREHRDSCKSDTRTYSTPRGIEEEARRSRSLDGDAIIGQVTQNKSKTPWKKVKDIIQTHRGSFKGKQRSRSLKSTGSITGSRDASPCESYETTSNFEDRNEGFSSAQASPVHKNLPSPTVVSDKDQCYTFPTTGMSTPSLSVLSSSIASIREEDAKSLKGSTKILRRSRGLSDFESLPENVSVDLARSTNQKRSLQNPINLTIKHDSSDAEHAESSPTAFFKSSLGARTFLKGRKILTPGNSSVPSSPSRHSEFFGEFESEDLSSGDFSEPCTPHRKLSPKNSLQSQQEEINEKYVELRERLNQEFEVKRQEWEKIRAACCATTSCAYNILGKEETPSKVAQPTKLLEDNLSADFKKKLHKWRVKKQSSSTNLKDPQTSPTKETEQKKIDWNLWKTGQIKLEGQGLVSLPDQKDLPEDFQKKLEQWKKMKESNSVPSYSNQDSLKRSGKSGQKKSKSDSSSEKGGNEREKSKPHEKDKLEKLSKLKAIVTEPPAKEIEVQTSAGVMKFEGISRKFTRKLYEWEKARGIGPESSTFALLHPGYRPLHVGNASQEKQPHENSPTLTRSLSLDSISPNPSVPSVSHQASSLSLNNMDELKENSGLVNSKDRRVSSNPELDVKDQNDEPEAVIVEVEDDIIETAAPLLTAVPILERQTPVYKYEVPCSDFCSGKEENVLQLKETQLNKVSSQTIENVNYLRSCLCGQEDYRKNVQHIQTVLKSLKETLPELENAFKGSENQNARDALNLVKKLSSSLISLLDSLNEEEACCKEIISEKTSIIDKKLKSLDKGINLVCKYLDKVKTSSDLIPKINITSHDGVDKAVAIVSTTPTVFESQIVVNQPKVLVASSASSPHLNNQINYSVAPSVNVDYCDAANVGEEENFENSTMKILNRNSSNGSKKKTRLRKMGSRQNSKTESDSTDEDLTNIVLETPRRLKRKTSRTKKISDDDGINNSLKKNEEKRDDNHPGEDIVYVLKIKPNKPLDSNIANGSQDQPPSNVLISPTESCVELMEVQPLEMYTSSANVFVKTKRKIFTTVEETNGDYKSVISRDIESSSASERNDKNDNENSERIITSLPPIPQSPSSQRRVAIDSKSNVTSSKEPSPSIRLMIAKYNLRLARERSSKSPPGSSGSCSPVSLRSPVLEHRVRDQRMKYQEKVEKIYKSASAGSLRPTNVSSMQSSVQGENLFKKNENSSPEQNRDSKIFKSSSAGTVIQQWGNSKEQNEKSKEDESSLDSFNFKLSLAYDSLKALHTNASTTDSHLNESSSPRFENDNDLKRDHHLYKKNKEKPTTLFTKPLKGSTAKKIGSKQIKADFVWRRCVSSSATGDVWPIQPDKSDNTVPKISRKLDNSPGNSKSSSPTMKESFSALKFPLQPSASAPTTPLDDYHVSSERPKTPISERALKLQKAKEEFLRGYAYQSSSSSNRPKSLSERDEEWKKRLSEMSVGSDTSLEECMLSKSASVGFLDSSFNPTQTDSRNENYFSNLPPVSRSGKFVSKFGFSSIASKFRKVKMRRGSKEQQSKMQAVSALCRQSLSIEISQEEGSSLSRNSPSLEESHKVLSDDNLRRTSTESNTSRETMVQGRGGESPKNLPKSGSTHAIVNFFKRNEKDKVNKSKSSNNIVKKSKP